MNKTFEKIYSENNVILNKDMALKENIALFEKVYAEAEMLNEMNPKLRALLAAGLIGTAGLGATSCSTPNDDYEEPTVIEQPATPETPGSTTETPAEPETEDSGKEEIVTETQKQLNTLLKIIDNNGFREKIKGVRYYPNSQNVLQGNSQINSFVISVSGITEPNDKNDLINKPAYCFGKAGQEGRANLYWVLKSDFPDFSPEDFLAAL